MRQPIRVHSALDVTKPARRAFEVAPPSPARHIAVAVDFSAASDRALERALAMARAPGDRVTLIHVVPGFSTGMPPHYYRFGFAEYQRGLVSAARQRLDRTASMQRTAATIDTMVLVGETTTEIGRVVDSIGADLLVVGVPKRTALARALFRTTAERLERVTSVPILAVSAVPSESPTKERSLPLAA